MAMLSAPIRCTHPPPPVPPFLLKENLSPKDISGSDITRWKFHAGYSWLHHLNSSTTLKTVPPVQVELFISPLKCIYRMKLIAMAHSWNVYEQWKRKTGLLWNCVVRNYAIKGTNKTSQSDNPPHYCVQQEMYIMNGASCKTQENNSCWEKGFNILATSYMYGDITRNVVNLQAFITSLL